MKKEAREAVNEYYMQGGSWANERLDSLRASRRTAWLVAIIAVVAALAEAVALMLLSPLKTVVPYTLLVDRQTGHVQALDPLRADSVTPDSALTQSFLVQYVIARESFDVATVQKDYKKVALWSANKARSDYLNTMQVTNADSPLARLPRTSVIDVKVRSVSPLSKNSALVRFESVRRDRTLAPQVPQSWIVTVGFGYANKPMSIEDRFTNPLGFQVTTYQKSMETLPIEPALQAPSLNDQARGAVSQAAPSTQPLPSGQLQQTRNAEMHRQ